jgi:uncharacterized protein YbjQ (UPF0145 family)
MLITTMNDVPGYEIEEVLGEVFGLTVRSRNVGSQFGAWLKSLRGGELKGMTKMLAEGRQHATERLVEEAEAKAANVIVAFRFDTSELGTTWTEICAYGTAVRGASGYSELTACTSRQRDASDLARRGPGTRRRSVVTIWAGRGATDRSVVSPAPDRRVVRPLPPTPARRRRRHLPRRRCR